MKLSDAAKIYGDDNSNETHLKIAQLRKDKRLSQTEMAELLGISQNAYSRMERGETKLTLDRIQDIAKILKIPYRELVTNDSKEYTAMYQDISQQYEMEKEAIKKETDILIKEKEKIIRKLESSIKDKDKIINDKEMIISLLQDKIKALEGKK